MKNSPYNPLALRRMATMLRVLAEKSAEDRIEEFYLLRSSDMIGMLAFQEARHETEP